jgi:hypothetical protein
MAHTCHPSYSGGKDQEDCGSRPAQANKFVGPFLKKKIQHKTGQVSEKVEECLPSKSEALSSNPNTPFPQKKLLRTAIIRQEY